jgi:hypothetical protein
MAYGMEAVHRFPGSPQFCLDVIGGLIERGVDVAAAAEVPDPHTAGFGHAFGFIAQRLFRGSAFPIAPILLNTYFPPNVPTAARCYDVGTMIRDVITEIPGQMRVAVIASGGLSHFVTDETLDRGVLRALEQSDRAHLRSVPRAALRSGSSEILNWIMVGGAVCGLRHAWTQYVPVYRTAAGTGVGMGFILWEQPTPAR